MLKAFSLVMLRFGTGFLLVIWALVKIGAPDKAIHVSEKYYDGLLSSEALQMPLGALQLLLGIAVILGIMRTLVYKVQAVVLGAGLIAIWQYIVDPLGLFLLSEETRNLLFFPSLTVFAATLALIAFREDDIWSLDHRLKNKSRNSA